MSDIMVVASKVKKVVKETGLRSSSGYLEAL